MNRYRLHEPVPDKIDSLRSGLVMNRVKHHPTMSLPLQIRLDFKTFEQWVVKDLYTFGSKPYPLNEDVLREYYHE